MVSEKILVVDDNQDSLELLKRNLEQKGYSVYLSDNVTYAIELLEKDSFDLVITDLKMPQFSGIDLIKHIKSNYKNTEVMMITGYATVESAIQSLKAGAVEYLSKPFTDEELYKAVNSALKKNSQHLKNNYQEKPSEKINNYGIIGNSESMREIFKIISKVSATNANVLIMGESGTGKELVARAIHYGSPRSTAPFVPVNCGGIPENLLESELFGFVKGAFTGAYESRAGFFQTADGGTIFLDEISEMSVTMQVKLLRVLQDKEVYMIGSNKTNRVDVRIIAATNKMLPLLVDKGLFREDLYYRLNVISITIPPLRERSDDIPMLVNYFIEKYAKEFNKKAPSFTDEAIAAIKNYYWPGNVREVENTIQRLVVMVESDVIDVPDLPGPMRYTIPKEQNYNRTLAEIEADYIKNVLLSVRGNKTKAAEILGIDRKTIREKLKDYRIDR